MDQQALMLKGYNVLDFSHFVAGPTCTRILAEMGANVIKVERSIEGDHVRQMGLQAEGTSTYYFQHSHSKRSLALDLHTSRGKELLLKMIPKIDVVVENFAPGVIADMGFGYAALNKINPKLVMCSISTAGQAGILSKRPGYDFIGGAWAGVIGLIGEPDRPPSVPTMAIGDTSTGVASAMAVGFALLNAERTGKGQYIDASLLDTYFHMHELCVPVISIRKEKFKVERSGSQHPLGSPLGAYKCNGGYILIMAQQHEIQRLGRLLGIPDILKDPRFWSNSRRVKNNDELKKLIEDWLAQFPDRESAIVALDRERVPCAPVLSLEETMAHPHMRERKTVRHVKDPHLGEFDVPGMPVKFSDWPDRTDLKASLVGEDNEAVLREMLGLSDAEIAALYSENVLIKKTSEPSKTALSSSS